MSPATESIHFPPTSRDFQQLFKNLFYRQKHFFVKVFVFAINTDSVSSCSANSANYNDNCLLLGNPVI